MELYRRVNMLSRIWRKWFYLAFLLNQLIIFVWGCRTIEWYMTRWQYQWKVVRIALEELLSWMLYFKVKSTLFIFTYTQDPIIYHIEEKYIIEYTKNKSGANFKIDKRRSKPKSLRVIFPDYIRDNRTIPSKHAWRVYKEVEVVISGLRFQSFN